MIIACLKLWLGPAVVVHLLSFFLSFPYWILWREAYKHIYGLQRWSQSLFINIVADQEYRSEVPNLDLISIALTIYQLYCLTACISCPGHGMPLFYFFSNVAMSADTAINVSLVSS